MKQKYNFVTLFDIEIIKNCVIIIAVQNFYKEGIPF
jgi:hypothetical protein